MATTRKQARERLVTLYTADGSFTGGVYGYRPKDLEGRTPVLVIDSLKTQIIYASLINNVSLFTFAVDVCVLRGTTSEDTLDALAEVIRQVGRTNVSDPLWANLEFAENSIPYYDEITGRSYRCERFAVTIKVHI